MKTLADFKRRLMPGVSVTVTFSEFVIRGNLETQIMPGREVTRKVHSVTPGCVIWQSETPLESHRPGSRLHWPKADCLTFLDADTVAVSHEPGGKPFATYRF